MSEKRLIPVEKRSATTLLPGCYTIDGLLVRIEAPIQATWYEEMYLPEYMTKYTPLQHTFSMSQGRFSKFKTSGW